MSVIKFVNDGEVDGWGTVMKEGWYFYGEDDGATMYGPYESRELCECALIRFVDTLNKETKNVNG